MCHGGPEVRPVIFVFLGALYSACACAQTFHSADSSDDGSISLSELLRVIQFYNADAFHCETGTEDGYAPDTGNEACAPHDGDYAPQDWSISLSELLRHVQLYNTGAYYACGAGEDSFCPGVDPGLEGEGEGTGNTPPVAQFFAGVVSGQAPLSVQFLDASTAGSSPISSWAWDFGDTTTSTEPNPTKVYADAGTYTVSLTVTSPIGSDTETRAGFVTVEALSPALLASSNPADGESGVAVTRETILTFTAPLDPAVVFNAAVTLRAGSQPVSTYRNLSPDGKTLTLFPSSPLPGNRTVRIDLDGSLLTTIDGRQVDVDGDGTLGGTRSITYSTLSLGALNGTSVSGRVFASGFGTGEKGAPTNIPLEGVEIFIDGRFDLKTTTDVNGNFRLEPVPAGEFFVHINGIDVETAYIDGTPVPTSFPAGPYYPFVGKRWEAVAGRDTSVGDVFLPLIPEGALTELSASEPTRITWANGAKGVEPEYEGAFVLVPPNALYNDFGTRGGAVGMAPVAPDRLPSPLPPGLELPLVITVQTNGPNNFDQPVPVCFPNLPDPATGDALPPGASSALWSFDHDEGDWKVVGTMTVSEDGSLVCSDPGMGIIEPGWHGTRPSTEPGAFPGGGPGFPPFESPQFCDIPEGPCVESMRDGGVDLLASLVPFARSVPCLWDLGYGFYTSVRDCHADSRSVGCFNSVIDSSVNTIVDCSESLSQSIPLLGPVISGISLVVDVLDNCTCLIKGGSSNPEIERLLRYRDFAIAYREVAIQQYGSAKWTDLDVTAGDVIENHARAVEILALVEEFSGVDSEGQTAISAGEAAQLQGLPLPTGISADDVADLIAYRNTTVEQWALELRTHAAAGRTDFIDESALLAALDAMLPLMLAVEPGPESEYDPWRYLTEAYGALSASFITGSNPAMPFSEIDYVLTENGSGLTSRGTLQADGRLAIAALAPERTYTVALYHLPTNAYAQVTFRSAPTGERTELPAFLMVPADTSPDTDSDGLPDVAEEVYDTEVDDADSDADGVPDLAELEAGTNPLDGQPRGTGLLAAVETPGAAIDLTASNEFVAVADGTEGVAVFNVYNGMPPLLVAQVDTPGNAKAIASDGTLLAVADGVEGMAVIDVSSPVEARLVAQFGGGTDTSTETNTVVAGGAIAYAGRADGRIVAYDMAQRRFVGEALLPEPVGALGISGNSLVAQGVALFTTLELEDGVPVVRGSFLYDRPFTIYRSVFHAGPVAYYTHSDGFDSVDVSDPENPISLGRSTQSFGGNRDVAANGNGLMFTCLGRGPSDRPLSIFDISEPTNLDALVDEFDTPGLTTAVALHNGFAYVTDELDGLNVYGYLDVDDGDVVPQVALEVTPTAGGFEGNSRILIRANATDDVEVRQVECFVDNVLIGRDGSFPHEFRYRLPDPSADSSVVVRVVAVDTGGNRSASATQTITISADSTPPALTGSTPAQSRQQVGVDSIVLYFNEPLNPASVNAGTYVLTALGSDFSPGGGDDTTVDLGAPALSEGNTVVQLDLPGGVLADGSYVFSASESAFADRSGNTISGGLTVAFEAVADANGRNRFNRMEGGEWSNPANWSAGRPPRAGEPVTIHLLGEDPTVVMELGFYTLGNLDVREALNIGEQAFVQLDGNASFTKAVSIAGTLILTGSASIAEFSGMLSAQTGGIINANDGSELRLLVNTSLSDVSIALTNATLAAPQLVSLLRSSLSISGSSANVSLPVLANIDDSTLTTFLTTLSLPLVTGMDGTTLRAQLDSTLSLDTAVSATDATFEVQGSAAVLSLDTLATAHNPTVNTSIQGNLELPALASVTADKNGGYGFSVLSGSVVLPALALVDLDGVTNGGAGIRFEASGGGTVDASLLAEITRDGNSTVQLGASDNAVLDLAALEALTGSNTANVSSGGQIMLDALLTLEATAQLTGATTVVHAPLLEDVSGSFITYSDFALALPALTTATSFALQLSQGAEAELNALETWNGGGLSLYDATASFTAPALTTLTDCGLLAYQGAALALPAVTAIEVTQPGVQLNIDGTGSTLSLPLLTAITLSATPSSLSLYATGGAQVQLPLLATIVTPDDETTVLISASGDGSGVDLSALTSFNGTRVTLQESSGGSITMP